MIKYFQYFYTISPCVQKCRHCYIPDCQKKKILSKKEIFNEINELKRLQEDKIIKDIKFYFHNEPSIHPQIYEILEKIKFEGMSYNTNLATNGFGFSNNNGNKLLIQFAKSGVKYILLSLFGNEKYHDEFTGRKGSYFDIVNMIELAKKNKIGVGLNLFLFNDNYEQIEKLLKTFHNISPSVSFYNRSDFILRHNNLGISKKYYEEIKQKLNITHNQLFSLEETIKYFENELVVTKNGDNIIALDLKIGNKYLERSNNLITDVGISFSEANMKYLSIGKLNNNSIYEMMKKPRLSLYRLIVGGFTAGILSSKNVLNMIIEVLRDYENPYPNEVASLTTFMTNAFDQTFTRKPEKLIGFVEKKMCVNKFWKLKIEAESVYLEGENW